LLAAAEVGGVALLIDAKSDSVAEWYARYGVVPLLDSPLTSVLPLATVEAALEGTAKKHSYRPYAAIQANVRRGGTASPICVSSG
jgi:hypothetical protein